MTKAFVPLESNPAVFTTLAHSMGVSKSLAFNDVFSVDDPDLLAFVPRPVEALVLVFPVSPTYEAQKAEEDARLDPDSSAYPKVAGSKDQDAVWVKQTIRNACGTYALLHALLNGISKTDSTLIVPDSYIKNLADKLEPLSVEERIKVLESDDQLEQLHAAVASTGDTEAPDANDSVELHYVAFTRSKRVGSNPNTLLELDGGRTGPLVRGTLGPDEDLLSETALSEVRKFIKRENENPYFSILALSPSMD